MTPSAGILRQPFRAARRPHAAEGGFTLIEVMVAVLIVAIGVLGVAGLQLLSLQNNTRALLRTQAFHAAYDIIDRARANPRESYAIAMDADPPTPAVDCATGTCSPAQLRDWDLQQWLSNPDGTPAGLAETLPDGDGAVAVNGDVLTVTVRWQDERDPAADPLEVSVTSAI